jgi:hypothetical protein
MITDAASYDMTYSADDFGVSGPVRTIAKEAAPATNINLGTIYDTYNFLATTALPNLAPPMLMSGGTTQITGRSAATGGGDGEKACVNDPDAPTSSAVGLRVGGHWFWYVDTPGCVSVLFSAHSSGVRK